jgi:peptidoglycan L-alanyl-D-glutamate endopeptidase CwlK
MASNAKWWLIGGAGVLILGLLSKDKIMEGIWDKVTAVRIAALHPAMRERAKQFIAEAARQGIFLRVTSGLRDFAEQAELYAQGRTKPGAIVTNAKPGTSFHNYGLAIDVVEIKDGKGLWDNPNWSKIASIGKTFGFAWGGDFKNLKDLPHFEYSGGQTITQLLTAYNTGKKDGAGFLTTVA